VSEPLVAVRGLVVTRAGEPILDRVDISVAAGEIVSLIGPNGAGKTTLVRAILGLIAPDAGEVRRRPGLRIGYVPQRVQIDPILPLTVRRFIALGGRAAAADHARVLDEVGVPHLAGRALAEISGGEFQRALLARALLRQPDLLVLDEPVQGVDVAGQAEIHDLIARIRDRRQCGVLMVSHDLHMVMAATDRVVCLNHHVCCAGHADAVSRHPEYIALFGPRIAETLALYAHHHDHAHDAHGDVVPLDRAAEPGRHRHG
jgi:zinc transport system ATP-binding protein